MLFMVLQELKGIHAALLQLVDAVVLVADRISPDAATRELSRAYKANGHRKK